MTAQSEPDRRKAISYLLASTATNKISYFAITVSEVIHDISTVLNNHIGGGDIKYNIIGFVLFWVFLVKICLLFV